MSKLVGLVKRFHEDECGAPEMSTVMIVACIAIPLVIAIILFGQTIFGWFKGAQDEIGGHGGSSDGKPGVLGGQ